MCDTNGRLFLPLLFPVSSSLVHAHRRCAATQSRYSHPLLPPLFLSPAACNKVGEREEYLEREGKKTKKCYGSGGTG